MLKLFDRFVKYLRKNTEDKINKYLDKHMINPISESLKIALFYGVISILWILTSDEILLRISGSIERYKILQTYKGLMFIFITTLVIFYLVFIRMKVLGKVLNKIGTSYDELSTAHEELIALEEELREQFIKLQENKDALYKSEQRYGLAVEGADCGIWDWDLIENQVYFSPKWKSYLGYEDHEIKNTYTEWENLLHPEERDEVTLKITNYTLSKEGSYENTYRMRCKNGKYKWIFSKGKAIRNEEGKVIRIAGSHTDITEKKLLEDKISSMAYIDKLTGLPNRLLFEEKVNELIEVKKLTDEGFALIYMDIDNFKHINDMLGHEFGDLLLKSIANILKDFIKYPNFVARSGGDEFTIIFDNIKDRKSVILEVEKLLKELRRSWNINSQEFYVSYSVGISVYPEHGINLSSLFKSADIAMYYVKKGMKDNYCFYSLEIENKNLNLIKKVNYLRQAIKKEEFYLLYQPIIDLKSGEIIGGEALIRWNHPVIGNIPPMEFIPLAEESGLINDIDKWVLETVLTHKKEWKEKLNSNIKISINMSGKKVTGDKVINEIRDLLNERNINPKEIQFEVTETSIMGDLEHSTYILKKIKELGIGIALDDFGTGYSSLTYLKKLPMDIVKLDREFIKNVINKESDLVIVEHIINLIHDLNLEIVAEGIEIEEQRLILKERKCNYGQGYLFSKPIAKEEFEKLIASKDNN
ncbi:bifunctional diguanylate cyclase/phosphodiesterase [Clostridium intestinale]|uniref:EAL domain-containing protein n=1 Tax=Clostridium intestinale TaxID=36845 RepID=A0A7D6VNU3_9CLOT|nr:GGDEF domain-containing phosphodiesterase [Clostridium intestinale]QLY78208.1 EAL domain-containing protein [Clostridium intestinale]